MDLQSVIPGKICLVLFSLFVFSLLASAPPTAPTRVSKQVEGVMLLIVTCFGIFGSVCSFIVLSTQVLATFCLFFCCYSYSYLLHDTFLTQRVHKIFHDLFLLLSVFDMVSVDCFYFSYTSSNSRILLIRSLPNEVLLPEYFFIFSAKTLYMSFQIRQKTNEKIF